MQFTFRALSKQDIKEIGTWRYPPPYTRYNGNKLTLDMRLFLLLRAISNQSTLEYFVAEDEQGKLVGLFQFIKRTHDTITVGLGMQPGLTGQGQGLAFVEAGLAFGRTRYKPTAFCLNVLAANQRAAKVYQRAGFKTVKEFTRLSFHGLEMFYEMEHQEHNNV
jgi:[ribosomal protein S18]-alanine N-acetyltransferase